jgi:hypothetical protein
VQVPSNRPRWQSTMCADMRLISFTASFLPWPSGLPPPCNNCIVSTDYLQAPVAASMHTTVPDS